MNTLFESQPALSSAPKAEKPLDKLFQYGTSHLSDDELLLMIVGEAATELYKAVDKNLKELGRLSLAQLSNLPNMTKNKAAVLTCAIELGRRKQMSEALSRAIVSSSKDVADYLQTKMQDLNHEVFCVMFLNRANKVIACEQISSGGITGTVADPRMILKRALELNGVVNLILSHNHPSGSLKPSRADEELKFKIKEAAKYFDMKVLDHVIVSQEGYYSFADEGIL
jgi:DNA repair protein RadC